MSKTIEELVRSRLVEWAQSPKCPVANGLPVAIAELCQSPIERMLLAELFFAPWDKDGTRDWQNVLIAWSPRCVHLDGLNDNFNVILAPQYPVESYRVDIAVFAGVGPDRVAKLAIECDGHNFHEKTKEQAAKDKKRDRFLQAEGFQVFRFTGSEIFNKGRESAAEIARYVDSLHSEEWRREANALIAAAGGR